MNHENTATRVLHDSIHADSSPFLSVILPMYREQHRIERTLRDIFDCLPSLGVPSCEILLIDDGSDDQTTTVCAAVVDSLDWHSIQSLRSIRLLAHSVNRGKGAAIRTGFQTANGQWQLIMDADNATSLDQVRRLLPNTEHRDVEIIIGSRSTPDSDIHAHRWRMATGMGFKLALRLLGLDLARDTQCGFKLYSKQAAQTVLRFGVETGYCFDIEHLLIIQRAGKRCDEVGIRWTHVDGGQVHPIRDGLKMLRAAHRIRNRIRSLGQIHLEPRTEDPIPASMIEPKPIRTKVRPAPTDVSS